MREYRQEKARYRGEGCRGEGCREEVPGGDRVQRRKEEERII